MNAAVVFKAVEGLKVNSVKRDFRTFYSVQLRNGDCPVWLEWAIHQDEPKLTECLRVEIEGGGSPSYIKTQKHLKQTVQGFTA